MSVELEFQYVQPDITEVISEIIFTNTTNHLKETNENKQSRKMHTKN